MSQMPDKQGPDEGVDAAVKTAGTINPADASRQRQEALLDEALEETFPASDPVSVAVVHQP